MGENVDCETEGSAFGGEENSESEKFDATSYITDHTQFSIRVKTKLRQKEIT
jgi:hypothetical protein